MALTRGQGRQMQICLLQKLIWIISGVLRLEAVVEWDYQSASRVHDAIFLLCCCECVACCFGSVVRKSSLPSCGRNRYSRRRVEIKLRVELLSISTFFVFALVSHLQSDLVNFVASCLHMLLLITVLFLFRFRNSRAPSDIKWICD